MSGTSLRGFRRACRCRGDKAALPSAQYEQSDILERDMMRLKLLQEFGWQIAVVLAKDWYLDRERVLEGLLARLNERDDRA